MSWDGILGVSVVAPFLSYMSFEVVIHNTFSTYIYKMTIIMLSNHYIFLRELKIMNVKLPVFCSEHNGFLITDT